MTSAYHLIAFWEQEEKELPTIGTHIWTTLQHNSSAGLPDPEDPLHVFVESHVTLKSEELRGFFGRIDQNQFNQKRIEDYKKRGLFQLPISNLASEDPLSPPPPPLIKSQGQSWERMRVYCTTSTADYEKFQSAARSCKHATPDAVEDWMIKREFVPGREEWQPIDYAQEWYRELKALHNASEKQSAKYDHPQVLNVDFNDICFVLLGLPGDQKDEDPSRDVITVVVQMRQDNRKDPIRVYRSTVDFLPLSVLGSLGHGDWMSWYNSLVERKEIDAILEW